MSIEESINNLAKAIERVASVIEVMASCTTEPQAPEQVVAKPPVVAEPVAVPKSVAKQPVVAAPKAEKVKTQPEEPKVDDNVGATPEELLTLLRAKVNGLIALDSQEGVKTRRAQVVAAFGKVRPAPGNARVLKAPDCLPADYKELLFLLNAIKE